MVAVAGIFAGADDFVRASTALCSSFQYINGANRRDPRAVVFCVSRPWRTMTASLCLDDC